MKILFICGSLEPGCDGVGDYTRRLAAELKKQGHPTAILALNDRYIKIDFADTQEAEGVILPVVRIAAERPGKMKMTQIKKWIDNFDPDWLSLQFVPFSFHEKGLHFGLGNTLRKIGKGKRWHIMFHELWVGMDIESSQKHVWWGKVQRQLIKALIHKLKPFVMHTQTQIYQQQIQMLGFKAEYLPLFANIAPNGKTATQPDEKRKIISLVIFGGIHPGAPVETFAKEAAVYAREKELQLALTIIGRCGAEKERWISAWQSEGLSVNFLGEQSPENISAVLTNASAGIATTPLSLIEKSGSVAAMREHGLPVICAARSWQLHKKIDLKPPPGIMEYHRGNLSDLFTQKPTNTEVNNISKITRQFLNTLSLVN